jgi:hypothetical protein
MYTILKPTQMKTKNYDECLETLVFRNGDLFIFEGEDLDIYSSPLVKSI